MADKTHPSKVIQAAIDYALRLGWTMVETGKSSHAFCRLYCGLASREGGKLSVWSTPRNKEAHARQIRKIMDACPHQNQIKNSDGEGDI